MARIFALTARRKKLPQSHETFQLWVESVILQGLTDPTDELGVVNGAQGEPSGELQQQFNNLPYQERALLYLYMVERYSLHDVSKYTGIPVRQAAQALNRIWSRISERGSKISFPLGWQRPDHPMFRETSETEED
ncbi:MAG: sigma-70 family RNA polymerase sigma factor [Planctomycetota bacterium]|nr:MAG: sigma-70 family RNA polymerase sigma factor [Planctomycetota bacterium]